jgi:hypothetical protein
MQKIQYHYYGGTELMRLEQANLSRARSASRRAG